jgi:hypothetical protein
LSSDTAQPVIVTAVTTASGAALGPNENHGRGHTAEAQVLSSGAFTISGLTADGSPCFVQRTIASSADPVKPVITTLRNV